MTNPHLDDFYTDVKRRFGSEAVSMKTSAWISKFTTIKGKPFSFDQYPFQREIINDMHPNMSCIKCSQVGATECQIRKFFSFLTRNTGTSGIYTLPDERMFKRVSATRIKPLLERDAVFNPPGSSSATRKVDIYQIGESFGYIAGNTEGEATSTPADMLIHDEVDISDPEILQLYQSRLQNSDHKITQRFSTPTYTGIGVDADYAASDQRHFLCKCSKCNHWNNPQVDLNHVRIPGLPSHLSSLDEIDQGLLDKYQINMFDPGTIYVACERCNAPLELRTGDREWIAKRPARSDMAHGYRLNPFCSDRIPVPYIIGQLIKMRKDNLRGWYNTVLGQPFNDENARLSETQIAKQMQPSYGGQINSESVPAVLGIDVGLNCHVIVRSLTSPSVTLHITVVKHGDLVDHVAMLHRAHNIVAGGIDRYPYTPLAEEIRDTHDCKILPVEYRGTATSSLKTDEFNNPSHLQVNRTQVIDRLMKDLRNQNLIISNYHPSLERTIPEHLRDLVRVEAPDVEPTWQSQTKTDHFSHAFAYSYAAERHFDLLNTAISTGSLLMVGRTKMGSGGTILHHSKS